MLKVLVIEDNDDHFLLIEDAFLPSVAGEVSLHHEAKLYDGLEALASQCYDVCLCDLQLVDASVKTTVKELEQLNTDTPVIVLTSHIDAELARSLLRHGIQDYLPKEDISPTLLHRMCIYAIERNKQQRELQDRNADMRAFCACLSHDFNGHLRHIHNMTDMLKEILQEKVDLGPDELNIFALLKKNTAGVKKLVDNLGLFLTVNHTDEHLQEVDLAELFKNLRRQIFATSEKNIEFTIKSDLPVVRGNESQLSILFQNLIENGIKYNQNSPHISVGSQFAENTGRCEILISDNGIGIDSKYFQMIFSPFKRLHSDDEFSGTGLGLSIVKRILEKHDGDIRIESETGKGSIFTISFPLSA